MRVLSFITCEDVRREADNKATLVGVYENLIVQGDWPAQVRLAAHLRMVLDPRDQVPDRADVQISINNELIAHAIATMQVPNVNEPIVLTLPMAILMIAGPGSVAFEIRFQHGETVLWEPYRYAFNVTSAPGAASA